MIVILSVSNTCLTSLMTSPLSGILSSDITANGAFYDHVNTLRMPKLSHRPSQSLIFTMLER